MLQQQAGELDGAAKGVVFSSEALGMRISQRSGLTSATTDAVVQRVETMSSASIGAASSTVGRASRAPQGVDCRDDGPRVRQTTGWKVPWAEGRLPKDGLLQHACRRDGFGCSPTSEERR